MIEYNRKLEERSRRLRTQMTDSEHAPWERLHRGKVQASQGLRVLRFDDLQVLKEIEGVGK